MAKKEKSGKKGFGKKWDKNQSRLGKFEPVPKGEYRFQIKEAEINPTKNKDGRVLTLTHEILKGDFKGKTVKEYICFEHSNPETERIAASRIASICDAIGVEFTELEGPEELVGKKFIGDVSIAPADGDYGPKNRLDGYEEYTGKDKGEKKEEGATWEKEEKKEKKKKKDKKKNKED